eukprot:gnl/Dysnectes_brevis/199_a228_7239.p1 GENE.gnl/Dysnectes_brevis/199_a228_7239~~gnl/Dysnectes_brevis/199_a228_7239.p1  ORF type:complete len:457 (+),score=127.12 gnl/Dysnectes_brevis/199_a228_7239:52-1422(+)
MRSFLLICVFAALAMCKREWPKAIPVIDISASSFDDYNWSKYDSDKDAISQVLTVMNNVMGDKLDSFNSYATQITSRIGYYDDFVSAELNAFTALGFTDVEFWLYNLFQEVCIDASVLLIDGSEPDGTYMGYTHTVREIKQGDDSIDYSSDLYEALIPLARVLDLSGDLKSSYVTTTVGLIGYHSVYDYPTKTSAAVLFDASNGALQGYIDGNSYNLFPTEADQTVTDFVPIPIDEIASAVCNMAHQVALGNGLPSSWVLRDWVATQPSTPAADYLEARNYVEPAVVVIATEQGGEVRAEETGVITSYSRTLGSEDDSWYVIQDCWHNDGSPAKLDTRLTLMPATLDTNVKDVPNFTNFYNALRGFPLRTSTTVFLAGMAPVDGTLHADLQKCSNVFDGKEVVACADPPPMTSWVMVILSILCMAGIVWIWYIGVQNAKTYEHTRLDAGLPAEASE